MMENNIKFRNHVSIIFENSLKAIASVMAIFFFNMISDIGKEKFGLADGLILAAVFAGIMLIILGIQFVIWSKTYISIEENVLVIERNTLNKNRNSIGLKNISNVNLEQNLFEMLLGTCKVKLDTNSLSTADQTDVNIILKKSDAEAFRKLVLAKAEGREINAKESESDTAEQEMENALQSKDSEENVITGQLGDIILHGLFSIRILMVVLFVGIIAIQGWMIADMGIEELGDTIVEIGASLFAAFYFAAIILWGIVKEFFKYLNFRIERKADKVYISYGLFKKLAYSVPVDKINAIRLSQTPIARMGKRYMVEIVNVGMDDDEKETNSFFLPYSRLETVKKHIHTLLPEFDGGLDIKEKKQPVSIWLLSIPWLILYVVIVFTAYILAVKYMPESDIGTAILFTAVVLFVWRTITKITRFLTRGVRVDEQFLKIVDGGLAKMILLVKYDKIQYVTGKQCVIARHFKIQKGTISILASMKNRIHELPYFEEIDMERLKKNLL